MSSSIKCNVVDAEGRWISITIAAIGYCCGYGDFSFSTCLASAFGWASNMIATSLDSQGTDEEALGLQ
ncbi:hypothetical protein ACS0TY_005590 [Phlomoides rotata]